VDPVAAVALEQIALEPQPVDLEGRVEREIHRADLAHLPERERVLGVVEEVAQSVLREVAIVEIPREAEPLHEIVTSDLDDRLTDLPARLARLLEQTDAQAGHRARELPREQVSRETAAEDGDVEIGLARALHSIPPFTEITWPVR
jgi:hypothetical protein